MSLVVNVRGTNGSTKSTTVRKFLLEHEHEPILDSRGKITDYYIPSINTYILGPYLTECGGCDSIKTQDEICDRIRRYADLGNILYEGLLVSGLFSRYDSLAKELSDHKFVFGFLDTPLEKCIAQTLARRVAKGNVKEFDPYKTLEPKFRAILSSRKHLENAGNDCRDIPHGDAAYATVLSWLRSEV